MFCYCRCCSDSPAALLLSTSFSFASARLWNRLPSTAVPCLSIFCCQSLKSHISSHFLMSLSDSSLNCTVPVQWLVILDTIVIITFYVCMCVRLFAMSCSCPVSSFHSESIQTQQEVSKVFATAQHRGWLRHVTGGEDTCCPGEGVMIYLC